MWYGTLSTQYTIRIWILHRSRSIIGNQSTFILTAMLCNRNFFKISLKTVVDDEQHTKHVQTCISQLKNQCHHHQNATSYICMCNITLLSTLLTSNLVRSHLVNPFRDWFVLQKPLGPEMDSCLFDHYSAAMIIFASILHTICSALVEITELDPNNFLEDLKFFFLNLSQFLPDFSSHLTPTFRGIKPHIKLY